MTKVKKLPIAEQIVEYEIEIQRVEVRISNCKAHIKELQKKIRMLKRPDAEEKWQKRMSQYNRDQQKKQRKDEELARRRARMAREVEQCLRMNGKIV